MCRWHRRGMGNKEHKLETLPTTGSIALGSKLIGWFFYLILGMALFNSKICHKATLRIALIIESLFKIDKKLIQGNSLKIDKIPLKRRNSF